MDTISCLAHASTELTDFLRNHRAHLARLKETRTAEVLTVNGRAEVVVLDAESYQELLDRLHHLETIAAVREGLASAERGELKPAEQVFAEMKAKYGLQVPAYVPLSWPGTPTSEKAY